MSYTLTYSDYGYNVHFQGDITIDEINEANGDIQGDYNFDEHKYQVVDLLDANLSSVTLDDAQFPAETDSVASVSRWDIKVALIARENHAVDISNKYIEYARKLVPKWEFNLFSSREDALKWAKSK